LKLWLRSFGKGIQVSEEGGEGWGPGGKRSINLSVAGDHLGYFGYNTNYKAYSETHVRIK
jgi:hypothetical protein